MNLPWLSPPLPGSVPECSGDSAQAEPLATPGLRLPRVAGHEGGWPTPRTFGRLFLGSLRRT
eukprot:13630815-Alexandrium_andersonii.AAC.1